MQTNITQKVALINSRKHTLKTYANREGKQNLVSSPFTTSGQETERV